MIEIIEQRAFARAIEKAQNIKLLLDHRADRVLGSTDEGSLKLAEDNVGLRAEAVITDEEVIAGARAGKLRGWSFNMKNLTDEVEERAGKLPLRKVHDFEMSEVSLIMSRIPIYSSSSIEIRAGESAEDVEERGLEDAQTEIEDKKDPNAAYLERLQEIKNKKFKEE